jgi:type IV pilus assembly protein PilB
MPMNDQVRDVINRGGSTEQIRDIALRNGLVPLRESGLQKAFDGITTIEEIIRETAADA